MSDLAQIIQKKAERKFREILLGVLSGDSAIFPLTIPYPRPKTSESLESLQAKVVAIKSQSREALGFGYEIQWEVIQSRLHGKNSFPGTISFPTEEDFFRYIGKFQEYTRAKAAFTMLVSGNPNLAVPALKHWSRLCEEESTFWEDILEVLSCFQKQPFPQCYIRELPAKVHTKFVEREKSLIEDFVKVVTPEAWQKGDSFEERLGLRSAESMFEFRLLDSTMASDWPLRHFHAVPSETQGSWFSGLQRFILTENRINFLTLPELPCSMAAHGRGMGVTRLARSEILQNTQVFYWGDIDVHGFQILANLRLVHPRVQSVMMDNPTFEEFSRYVHQGKQLNLSLEKEKQLFKNLTDEEIQLFQHLHQNSLRLEQEQISNSYAVQMLKKAVGRSCSW